MIVLSNGTGHNSNAGGFPRSNADPRAPLCRFRKTSDRPAMILDEFAACRASSLGSTCWRRLPAIYPTQRAISAGPHGDFHTIVGTALTHLVHLPEIGDIHLSRLAL